MARTWLYAGAFLVIFAGTLFQVYFRSPTLDALGFYRTLQPLNHKNCKSVPELQACEKITILSSGIMYLACAGTIESRTTWMPTLDALNVTAALTRSNPDFLATYDINTGEIIKLTVKGLVDPRGLNLHGMDVVPDETDPRVLWIYLVNHRPQVDSAQKGADSVIEIFKTHTGAVYVEWVQTVGDARVMVTPNDIVGGGNGKEFWFTNDNGVKVGLRRHLDALLWLKTTFVGYCHITYGCKKASVSLYGSNGITRAFDGSILVGSYRTGQITVHKPKEDKTLEHIYEDDGQLGSFATTAAMYGDTLYIHGGPLHLDSSPRINSENAYLRIDGSSDAGLQDSSAKLALIDVLSSRGAQGQEQARH
ncbi:unnamed protein product [Rhizoctonia solani]|uniref:Serum paraoxonase/arylesterase 1 n=1 Tax=Rhizoctonia solani TaxID=456999 RepID=A0A8H2X8P4_9AGAM|nr:unnamed protein product [Rhizoctonia solani]